MPAPDHSLDPFFKPASVAVVGASAAPGSVGSILMRNLLGATFGGVVYPVNPKRKSVHGVRAYPSLREIPEVPDLAVVATPAVAVPDTVAQCVERGIPAAILISAGFSELGEKGRELEKQIKDTAHGKMRLIGPNCLGIIHPPSNLNASFASSMARPGRVALLSQSGAICTAILDWAREKSIGFSTFVSVGTMADVDFADLLDYFGDDPNTRSIVLYMESVGDVRKFFSAARAVARTKQVIVVKSGRHEAGARAAASHTGALAGSDAVFDAAVRRAGVLRVTTIPDLFNMAEILSTQPPPRGPALAIITNAGGPGVMATDALMTGGGQLATLTPKTLAALNAVLPPFWSHANPIDVLGDATAQRYRQALEICAKDTTVDGLLILLTPQAMTDPSETARQLAPLAKLDKPVLASWMGGADVRDGRRVLGEAGLATFDSPEAAIKAFLHMVQYRRNQELLYERPAALPEDWAPDQKRVQTIIEQARRAGRALLTEVEAKQLLGAYGIPVVETNVAQTPERAVALAQRLGYPVVLKLLSETITHKSDAGGVQLNLADDNAVRDAFATIERNCRQYSQTHGYGPERFQGVTVQPMVRHKGYELIVGSSVDVQFGPVILFGAGGVLVEIFQDRALGLPPLNRTLARRLMERTQIFKALQGVRGQKAVPLDQLETLLVRFSYLLCDFLQIQEIDINPLLAGPDGLVALDARVLLCPSDLPAEKRNLLTIEPYPNQYTTEWQLKDGTPITIRAIRPEDEPLIIQLHSTFSERTIRLRFFSMVKTLSRESLIRLCHLDYAREMALVAQARDGRLLGVSRYYMHPETRVAEYAIVVTDEHQGQGLGQHLMERLIAVARERGVKRLVGLVLRDNTGMLGLARDLGFAPPSERDQESVEVTLDL
ncbi:MAG: bifunctional acetate--CoA ligase family protein/GNAT family N-acetyltransferase [Gemmataceae bacterium]|nr:bifunctional acetate--CoA ligase family protein/GNAT family N-acetyltransferase [Gemmataceae bacterium]MCI0741823.1 bifunctional acetate--CoA ligase family protein/GNAT family N-acetyltransferase [Gemmataceae bacterium]